MATTLFAAIATVEKATTTPKAKSSTNIFFIDLPLFFILVLRDEFDSNPRSALLDDQLWSYPPPPFCERENLLFGYSFPPYDQEAGGEMRYSVVCIGLMGLLGLRQVDTEITIYTTGELVIRIYPGLLIVKIYFAMSRFSTSSLRLENSRPAKPQAVFKARNPPPPPCVAYSPANPATRLRELGPLCIFQEQAEG